MLVLPGLILAMVLALAGEYLSRLIGIDLMGLPRSPISPILMAVILGMMVGNTVTLPASVRPGIRFGLVRMLRLGIILLGVRLSLGQAGLIGLKALPVIIGSVTAALLLVTYLARKMGLSNRLGTLIAVGTSVCGATAIVATAPAIGARDDEVSYAIACVTIFGIVAMLLYPFAGYLIFDGDTLRSGLFLGTSVHETAQVAGAGLVYQQYYSDPGALDVATVTKLVRNLGMLVIIPLMSIVFHRNQFGSGTGPKWYTMVPLFVIGFACMSLLRTMGDMSEYPFGVFDASQWQNTVAYIKRISELCLCVAMAAVGLGTNFKDLRVIGARPFGVGLFSAALVGCVSIALISLIY